MNILVTAGNTLVPIDRVRCLTNIFTGRTGAGIALRAHQRGHTVTLLTSHPETVTETPSERLAVYRYRTFDDLQALMADHVRRDGLDAVIHSAAVSDYDPAGVYSPSRNTRFCPADLRWESKDSAPPALVDRAAGKVKSDEPELWLRLVRTPKLVDAIRADWGFRGVLVKFKLEVWVGDQQLLDIAERSRRQSDADLMVANTLEDAASWAYLGPIDGQYIKTSRRELAERLLDAVERIPGGNKRG
jgi:phosphopantothenoylcysteine synthetase/decarboxylase